MARRQTIQESNWPIPDDFVQLARRWKPDAMGILFSFVWAGYDSLSGLNLDFDGDSENLERNISQLLSQHIDDAMTGDEPFFVQHGPYEDETRDLAPAQPPQYDIGFVLRRNPRSICPLEAKVLHTENRVSEYTNDVKEQFLKCRYSPFSSEAGMLGYLLKGFAGNALDKIATSLNCSLEPSVKFANRPHRISHHKRVSPQDKSYPIDFACNHLILAFCPQS